MHVLNYESANKPFWAQLDRNDAGATSETEGHGFVGSPAQRSSNYVLRGRL